MNKIIKYILILVVSAGVLLAVVYFLGILSFSGAFDTKYTREELTGRFTRHEKEFADVVTYFNTARSNNKEQLIYFGLGSFNRVSLTISPQVIDPANKTIGGTNLRADAPALDSVLVVLGWTNETVLALRDKLRKTNCDYIMVSAADGSLVMAPDQSGWGWFTYHIFESPKIDTSAGIHGKTLGNSEFGRRVVLDYSSAL
jgi:hypothetical protein